jgi:hypothetical protein
MPLPKVPIVEHTGDIEHNPLKVTDVLVDLQPTDSNPVLLQKIEDQKNAFEAKVKKLNMRLDEIYGKDPQKPSQTAWQRFWDHNLALDEYALVMTETKNQLEKIESDFNDQIATHHGRSPGALNAAMGLLNTEMDNFISGKLEEIIDTADDTGGDSVAFMRKMRPESQAEPPQKEQKKEWGEKVATDTKSAIAKRKDRLDRIAGMH